jgi:hypothetical protein
VSNLVSIVEMTWYVAPGRGPGDADKLLDLLSTIAPWAKPTRFGPGDPPMHRIADDDLRPFSRLWTEKAEDGLGINWLGREPHLFGSYWFEARRPIQPGEPLPIEKMTWLVNRAWADHDPSAIAQLFADIAQGIGSFYGCAYILDGWIKRGRTIMLNVDTSDQSSLPSGDRWLGIPPGAPWLAWFGAEYVQLLGPLLEPSAVAVGDGALFRRSLPPIREADDGPVLDLPEEVLARSKDPRFDIPPSLPALLIPLLRDAPDSA